MTLTNIPSLEEATKVIKKLGADDYFIRASKNPLFFSKMFVEDGGELIAASLVRITSEVSIFLNKESSNITKAKVMKRLLDEQIWDCKKLGIDQVLAFTKDSGILENLGFRKRDEDAFILHF